MPSLQPHLLIALATLTVAAYQDLRTRRIPNRLLLFATTLHLVFVEFEGLNHQAGLLSFFIAVLIIAMPSIGYRLIAKIGMGDIKLLVYTTWSLSTSINWSAFITTLAATTAIALGVSRFFGRGGSNTYPFAPFLAFAAISGVVS